MATDITEQMVGGLLANPFYCIDIHPMLISEHPKAISVELWKEAALQSIKEDPEMFLDNLLSALKGDIPLLGYEEA